MRGGVGEGRQDARKELWGVCPKGNPAMEGNRRQRQRVFDEHLRRSNLLGGDIYSLLSRRSLHPCHRLLCCRWRNSSLSASKRNLKQNSTDCPVFILILVHYQELRYSWTLSLKGRWVSGTQKWQRQMWVQFLYRTWLFKLEYSIIMESITVFLINDFSNPNLNSVVIRTLTRQLTFWSSPSGNMGPTRQSTTTPRTSSNWQVHVIAHLFIVVIFTILGVGAV